MVATPTASGKSLCFHLPVLETLSRDREARALYLYPTKALSRDQEASLGELIAASELGVARVVYDGDTPGDARRAARDRGAVIVMTNPDMLSAGILPHHAQWARLFQGLKFVVLDELHTYRGVFGSHMAHVIARLSRVARFHGSNPTFLCATATIGNPREHAARLLGKTPDEVALVDRSGAPRGERRVFVFNPPVVNSELGIRASYLKSAVKLASDLIEKKVPTIVFGPSRNSVEIMLKYLRDDLARQPARRRAHGLPRRVPARNRRQIERDLREGKILGVVATNALELGIDIGSLDAVVCAGYPGSIAALWQRFGRAGRRSGGSIAVLVTSSAPVDQYFARDTETLLGAPVEEARIDPDQRRDRLAAPEVRRLRAAVRFSPNGQRCRCCRGARALRLPRRERHPRGLALLGPSRRGARDRRALSLGRRRLSGQPRLAAQHRVGQLRDHRSRDGPRHRRARLALHAHHAARAGHLPTRGRAVPGRGARLRKPQSVRDQSRARLLHHRDGEPRGVGHRGERRRDRSERARSRGARCRSSRRSPATRR